MALMVNFLTTSGVSTTHITDEIVFNMVTIVSDAHAVSMTYDFHVMHVINSYANIKTVPNQKP